MHESDNASYSTAIYLFGRNYLQKQQIVKLMGVGKLDACLVRCSQGGMEKDECCGVITLLISGLM